jgi:hypothetical protein
MRTEKGFAFTSCLLFRERVRTLRVVISFIYFATADTVTSLFHSRHYSVPFLVTLVYVLSKLLPPSVIVTQQARKAISHVCGVSEESRLVLMILIEGNCHRSRAQLLSPRCHQSYGLVTRVLSVLGIAV